MYVYTFVDLFFHPIKFTISQLSRLESKFTMTHWIVGISSFGDENRILHSSFVYTCIYL